MRMAKTLGLCGTALAGLAFLIAPHGCSQEPKMRTLPLGQRIEIKPASINGAAVAPARSGLALDGSIAPQLIELSFYIGPEGEHATRDEGAIVTNPVVTVYGTKDEVLFGPTSWTDIIQLGQNCPQAAAKAVYAPGDVVLCAKDFPSVGLISWAKATQDTYDEGKPVTQTLKALYFTTVLSPDGTEATLNASFY